MLLKDQIEAINPIKFFFVPLLVGEQANLSALIVAINRLNSWIYMNLAVMSQSLICV